MEERTYLFRREDNGQIVEVDFTKMMEQDAAGYIELDGVTARRCVYLELERDGHKDIFPFEHEFDHDTRPIVSDALGFPECQFDEMEKDRLMEGHVGVEFRRDPAVPQFFQVHCSSRKAWQEYLDHRGMVDQNKTVGVLLSEEDLERAKRRMCAIYDDPEADDEYTFDDQLHEGFLMQREDETRFLRDGKLSPREVELGDMVFDQDMAPEDVAALEAHFASQ